LRWEWNAAKAEANLAKHGVAFDAVHRLGWDRAARVWQTVFGEPRVKALVPLGDRLHVCVYVERGEVRRLISLRKANRRETLAWLRMTEGA
jgi:uncharacterized DUF497 family protein